MDRVDLFPTTLWMGHLGLDTSMILENVIEWKGGTVLQDNISKEEGKGNDFSCKGKPSNLCYANSDCISNSCGVISNSLRTYNFSKFNPDTSEFKNSNPSDNRPKINK